MIRKTLFLVSALCLFLTLATGAQAGKFYKWLDEDGVTHYGENPPDTETATVINVKSGASSDQQQAIDRLEAQRKAAADEAKADVPTEEDEIERRNREIMANNCKIQRSNLGQLKANRRVKTTDENGEVRYLDEQEIAQRIKEVQQYLDENCKNL
ncbi:MAG: DUF4124 domain-containing protein [Pseudomonadota bacterium]|nr:DUF4124 domain-containing protein [Pseudomonadota bacterium]